MRMRRRSRTAVRCGVRSCAAELLLLAALMKNVWPLPPPNSHCAAACQAWAGAGARSLDWAGLAHSKHDLSPPPPGAARKDSTRPLHPPCVETAFLFGAGRLIHGSLLNLACSSHSPLSLPLTPVVFFFLFLTILSVPLALHQYFARHPDPRHSFFVVKPICPSAGTAFHIHPFPTQGLSGLGRVCLLRCWDKDQSIHSHHNIYQQLPPPGQAPGGPKLRLQLLTPSSKAVPAATQHLSLIRLINHRPITRG